MNAFLFSSPSHYVIYAIEAHRISGCAITTACSAVDVWVIPPFILFSACVAALLWIFYLLPSIACLFLPSHLRRGLMNILNILMHNASH